MRGLTKPQLEALKQLPQNGDWGLPKSTVHNGTLLSLIQHGLIEWRGGEPRHIWQLNYGDFRLSRFGMEWLKNEAGKN